MARYTGPRVRISRRFGVPIFGPIEISRAPQLRPGRARPKVAPQAHRLRPWPDREAEAPLLLRPAWNASFAAFMSARSSAVASPANRCSRFWRRAWTTSFFTLVLAIPAPAARQMVCHGHVKVNGRKVNIPSFALKVNDVDRSEGHQCLAPVGDPRAGNFHQPRRAGLAVAEQGRFQGRGHAHPDPRRDSARSPTSRRSSNFIPAK